MNPALKSNSLPPAPVTPGPKKAGIGTRIWKWMRTQPFILYEFILMDFVKSFALALAVCLTLLLLVILIVQSSNFEDFGLSVGQMAMLSPFLMPQALAMALPPATLVGTILVIGRLAAENEVLAAQSGGASIARLSIPIIFCSMILSVVGLFCNGVGVDWGYSYIRNELLSVQKNPKLIVELEKEGRVLSFSLGPNSTSYLIMLPHRRDPITHQSQHPIYYAKFDGPEVSSSFFASHYSHAKGLQTRKGAEGGENIYLPLILFNGQTLGKDMLAFKKCEWDFDLPSISDKQIQIGTTRGSVGFMINDYTARKIRESVHDRRELALEYSGDVVVQSVTGSLSDPVTPTLSGHAWMNARNTSDLSEDTREKERKELVEYHKKVSLSLMPLSMAVLGIGLGLLVRKGNRLIGIIGGLLTYAILYYPMTIMPKEMANKYMWLPQWSLWLPNVVMGMIGLVLCHAHEKGYLGGGMPNWARVIWDADNPRRVWNFLQSIWTPVAEKLALLLPFRGTASTHVATTFFSPFVAVCLAVGGMYVTLDLMDHGAEVVEGLVNCGDTLGDLPGRTFGGAVYDMAFYYLIRALGLIFDLLPEMVLIAGVLAATTMVRNNEHLILKSTGMRLQRAFGPILLLATMIALGVSLARETVWPSLVIERDRLKPYVYHKPPKPKSMTGLAMDEKNRAVIYSISMYNRDSKQCRGFNVYFPEEAVDGRIPYLSADYATWNYEKDEWTLSSIEEHLKHKPKPGGKKSKGETGDKPAAEPEKPKVVAGDKPTVEPEKPKVETADKPTAEKPTTDKPAADKPVADKPAADKPAATDAEKLPTAVAEVKQNKHGFTFTPQSIDAKSGSFMWKAHEIDTWKGTLTPNFLDSERYGPSVMSMWELLRQKDKIGYRAEIWRRLFEWVIAGTLLMCCIPWLVRQDIRSAMTGVAISILFGLMYRLAVMGSFELVHSEYVNFAPLPLLPHVGFLALGIWSYFYRMET